MNVKPEVSQEEIDQQIEILHFIVYKLRLDKAKFAAAIKTNSNFISRYMNGTDIVTKGIGDRIQELVPSMKLPKHFFNEPVKVIHYLTFSDEQREAQIGLLEYILKRLKLNKTQLADKIGVTEHQIADCFTGKKRITGVFGMRLIHLLPDLTAAQLCPHLVCSISK